MARNSGPVLVQVLSICLRKYYNEKDTSYVIWEILISQTRHASCQLTSSDKFLPLQYTGIEAHKARIGNGETLHSARNINCESTTTHQLTSSPAGSSPWSPLSPGDHHKSMPLTNSPWMSPRSAWRRWSSQAIQALDRSSTCRDSLARNH